MVHNDALWLVRLARLFDTLNEQGIRYCHWKSNCNLDRSMQGLTDLDLLVDRSHSQRFREILCQYDFKPVLSSTPMRYPAIEDYLGFDRAKGCLIHLHVHYQLILGEQYVKNYHLPLEQSFLDSSHTYSGIKIASPEMEVIVLAIRALLKYRDRDVVRGIFSARHRELPAGTLKEFEYLLSQTTLDSISDVVKSQVKFVSPDILLEFLTALQTKVKPAFLIYRLRNRLRRELAPFQRYGRPYATFKSFRADASRRWRKFARQSQAGGKKTMMSGGLRIAIVGADGAGKSTVVHELARWLSWKLEVCTNYMGSRHPSAIAHISGWMSQVSGMAYRACSAVIGEENARPLYQARSLLHGLHLIAIGRDRYYRYLAGQRRASQGALVIYDRYPLEGARVAAWYMDGPRIASTYADNIKGTLAAMARMEQGIYQRIRPPDHLVILHISPDVSFKRKPQHRRQMIEAKSQALRQFDWESLPTTEIDANQPLDQVLLQAKAVVWDLL